MPNVSPDVPMRVLIQNVSSLRYITQGGGWSKNPDVAFDFKSSVAALQTIKDRMLEGVHIVLKFKSDALDVKLTTHGKKPQPPV